MLGEIEALTEWPSGDSTVQNLGVLLLLTVLVPSDKQRVLLLDEFDLVRGEARQGHGDAVVVLAGPLDIVRRPVRLRVRSRRLIEQLEQAVEANGRAIKGGEVVGSHGHILRRATWKRERRIPIRHPMHQALRPWATE